MEVPENLDLSRAWVRDAKAFGEWLTSVSDAYSASHLSIEPAARLVGATPAELEAALRLGLLDEEELDAFDGSRPPKTTWFQIADASPEAVVAVAELIGAAQRPPTSKEVLVAIETVDGASVVDQVGALDADVFTHMFEKASQYNALTEKSRKALKGFGSRKRGGRELTIRQIGYAANLLRDLVEDGVVRRESPDGDQEMCDLVLDALNR